MLAVYLHFGLFWSAGIPTITSLEYELDFSMTALLTDSMILMHGRLGFQPVENMTITILVCFLSKCGKS